MPAYHDFSTARTTTPDPVALRTAVQTATGDPSAVLYNLGDGWHAKKAAAWTAPEIAAVQTALDTVAALTVASRQQQDVDAIPVREKAIVLVLLDQLNIIRAALPTPLAPITPAQAIAAIRTKAGNL